MTTESTAMEAGLDRLLSIEELAEYLGVPIKTIYDWRLTGRGPCAIRVGRHLKFAVPMSATGSRASARRFRAGRRGGVSGG